MYFWAQSSPNYSLELSS